MSTWISIDGEWYPKKERVMLPHLIGTENEIYEGPDRAALLELHQKGVEKLGRNFKNDPEFIHYVRQVFGGDVEQALKILGYYENREQRMKKIEKEKAEVNSHTLPRQIKKVKALQIQGGGKDLSGNNNHYYGWFGEAEESKNIPNAESVIAKNK